MRGPKLRLLFGVFAAAISFKALTANRNLEINGDWAAGSLPQIDTDGVTLKWISPGALGGGTVSSVSLGANATSIFSIANGTTTPTITLANQSSALVFAGPATGGAAAPTFRALAATDIPALDAAAIGSGTFAIGRLPVGSTAGTVAAGDDSRFHAQGTDAGTTSQTFQLQSGAGGARIKNNAGAIEIRNATDTNYADLVVQNLVVQGTTTTINTETVTIADNIIVLNSDFAGTTPTENGGIQVNRGTQTAAALVWNESSDRWQVGLVGAELNLPRQRQMTFTNANLTAGVIALAHNLDNQYPDYRIYDNTGKPIEPADVAATSENVLTLDFSGVTVTGTYVAVITG
jgi:hypothetical protein